MATQIIERPQGDAQILTSAIGKIADFWGLSNAKLGTVIGVSAATVSRFAQWSGNARPSVQIF